MTAVVPASIAAQLQLLAPSAVVELFQLDLAALGGPLLSYHGGTNGLSLPVVWQGVTYYAFPVSLSGLEYNGRGSLPRPKLQVANVTGVITGLILAYGDLIGAKLTRKRTMVRFLDAVNFTGGVNATADSTASFPDDVFFIEQRTLENRNLVEFQLAAAFDFQGVQLPRRPIVNNVCTWVYRSAECGYTGTAYFDVNDNGVSTLASDLCGKRLSSCQIRFGGAALPYGGFPGAGLLRT